MHSANATTVRWLDDSEMRAWRTYVETVVDLTTALEADLAPTGLTLGDYQVLVYLSEAPERRDADVRPRRRGCSCRRAG